MPNIKRDVLVEQSLKGDMGMKLGPQVRDFTGVLQHPNGDLVQVNQGVVVAQVGKDDPQYDKMQTGFLSTQDESGITLGPNGEVRGSLYQPRSSGERETGPSSNPDIGGPNFQEPLSGPVMRQHNWRETWDGKERMLISQSVSNAADSDGVTGTTDSLHQGMLDELAKQEGRESRLEEPKQIRNARKPYELPEYAFDMSLTDGMVDPSAGQGE